jgi:hypothetical protein
VSPTDLQSTPPPASGPANSEATHETPAVRLTLEPYSGPRSARAVVAFASATQKGGSKHRRAQQLGLLLLVLGLGLLVAGAIARLRSQPDAPAPGTSSAPH